MALALIGSGMITSVGSLAPTSCAAIRCGLNRFGETRFKFGGEWIVGAAVRVHGEPRGAERLLAMAAHVLDECLEQLPAGAPKDTVCVVCLPEHARPGRPQQLERLFDTELVGRLRRAERLRQGPHLRSGRLESVQALKWFEEILHQRHVDFGIMVSVDSLLSGATLRALHESGRLLASVNSKGFIPGEAAAGVVVARPSNTVGELQILGIGWGQEPAFFGSGLPLRGEGLAAAIRDALKHAGLAQEGCGFAHLDYRIGDASGEDYGLREAALALVRVMRVRKREFPLWLSAECLGEVGVAAPCIALGVALAAARRSYAPGPGVLAHFSADDGGRAAAVLRQFGLASTPPMEVEEP
jgi:3-oxoacyl-[acyl-carrier-protein] synthase-1